MQKNNYTFLIDLDNTLYLDIDTDFSNMMSINIQNFMVSKLGFDANIVASKQMFLYKTYGNSLTGLLEEGYKINFDEWYNSIHSILPYHLIKENKNLLNTLENLAKYGRCIVFTNADMIHTVKVLKKLGLYDFFITENQLITFNCLNKDYTTKVLSKPNKDAFTFVLNKLNIVDPSTVVFIDDSISNIKSAYEMGIKTIHITTGKVIREADLTLHNMEKINNEEIEYIYYLDILSRYIII